ncbi:MAG TPA: ABC transporter ATP-binding protein, partial [Minicystis sp.]|nr:ABC transporter ATP-binding protein [Minicystis sp.]
DVRALVKSLAGEHTVLLSTHILPEVEATCSRALVIARGKLVAEGAIDAIRARRRASGARLVVRGEAERAAEIARGTDGIAKASASLLGEDVAALDVETKADADGPRALEALVAALVAAGLGVREVVPRRASLEQVFSELTGDAPAAEEARA